jgi:catechol 2,3-dioxygenase-like lactoylglutathione lyase family enzyme
VFDQAILCIVAAGAWFACKLSLTVWVRKGVSGMQVKRIVANIASPDTAKAAAFYRDVLGLDIMMDHGWIVTFGNDVKMSVQLSIASQGGADTPVPDLSIEVDDIAAAETRMRAAGIDLEYGPVDEEWGVRRFFVRDPFGRLVNILAHKA